MNKDFKYVFLRWADWDSELYNFLEMSRIGIEKQTPIKVYVCFILAYLKKNDILEMALCDLESVGNVKKNIYQ